MFLEIVYKSTSKILEFENEEINDATKFVAKVLDAFGVSDRSGRKLVFMTHAGSVIPPMQLNKVIEQFRNCGCFVLKMVFTDHKESQSDLSVRLKEYIVRHEGDEELFVEEIEDKLSPRSQDIVLKYVLEFLKNQYTLSARPDDVIQVCKAVIALFPSLKVEHSEIGGIDLLYDRQKRKGILYNKIMYGKRAKKIKERTVLTPNKRTRLDGSVSNEMPLIESNDQSEDEIVEDDAFTEMATALISFFEKCKLPQHAPKVKKKFEETIELRKKMMLSIDEYKPLLDLYLVLPDLIMFDFRLNFPAVDNQALQSVWPQLKTNANTLVGKNSSLFDGDLKKYKKNGDIKTLAKLVKLLPSHRKQYKTAMSSLLTISEDPNVDPMSLMSQQNDTKIIAIQSPNNSDEIKYYIQIKRYLISVKPGSDFISVLDMYFKAHKIFGIFFCDECEEFMVFLDHFVYLVRDAEYGPNTSTLRNAKLLLQI